MTAQPIEDLHVDDAPVEDLKEKHRAPLIVLPIPDRCAPTVSDEQLRQLSTPPGRDERERRSRAWPAAEGRRPLPSRPAGRRTSDADRPGPRSTLRTPGRRTAWSSRDDDIIDVEFGPQRTPTAELPDASAWSGKLGTAFIEVCLGARPVTQVMRWCSPAVLDSLIRRQTRVLHRGEAVRRPVRVRRVRICHVCDGIAEASIVVDDGGRSRAVALRLEGLDRRWVVTALEVG